VRRVLSFAVLLFLCTVALADGAKPAVLGITETAPGQYAVEFRVPRSGNRIPALTPVLPNSFRTLSEPEVELTPGERITRWRVAAAPWEVAGEPIRIEGLAAAINDTIVRFRFLDGGVVSRILMPEMPVTEFPVRTGGPGAAAAESTGFRTAVLEGARHVGTGPGHLVFLLGLGLAAGLRSVLKALGVFAVAQVAGVVLASAAGLAVPEAPAEALLAVAGVVAVAHRRIPTAMAAVAGLVHGATMSAGWLPGIGMALGTDAAQMIVGITTVSIAAAVGSLRLRTLAMYAVGAAGIFFALFLVTETESAPRRAPGAPLLLTLIPAEAAGPNSVALSPADDSPVRVFLAVEPVEIRVEAVLLLDALLPRRDAIPVAEQDELKAKFAARLEEVLTVTIDGATATPSLTRIDFVERTSTGVLERPQPQDEPFDTARLGVVLVYPVKGIPEDVKVDWPLAAAAGEPVSVTISDPERTFVTEGGSFSWRNELREPPAPTAEAVAMRRPAVRLSAVSIILILAALALLATRRGRTVVGFTAARVSLAAAGLVAPLLPVSLPLPAGAAPDASEASAIVEALLTNVHRAFDHHDESDVYERLAVSVTGEELTTIYLEHRRNLLLAAQGGARARADAVEITKVADVAESGDGFRAGVTWQVSGFVVHFGHRHFRRNVYRADVDVVPDGEAWKLRGIEVREKKRVR